MLLKNYDLLVKGLNFKGKHPSKFYKQTISSNFEEKIDDFTSKPIFSVITVYSLFFGMTAIKLVYEIENKSANEFALWKGMDTHVYHLFFSFGNLE